MKNCRFREKNACATSNENAHIQKNVSASSGNTMYGGLKLWPTHISGENPTSLGGTSLMKTNHSQWKKIRSQEHQASSKCETVVLDATLTILKSHVLSLQFPTVFYAVSTCFNGFLRCFCSGHFFERTHLVALDDLHHCREKKYVHPELSFIEGCACDLTILKFSRIIESTIASFQIMLNPFDCHKTTLASFLDALHTNSANHTVPRHKVPPTPKKHSKTNLL